MGRSIEARGKNTRGSREGSESCKPLPDPILVGANCRQVGERSHELAPPEAKTCCGSSDSRSSWVAHSLSDGGRRERTYGLIEGGTSEGDFRKTVILPFVLVLCQCRHPDQKVLKSKQEVKNEPLKNNKMSTRQSNVLQVLSKINYVAFVDILLSFI